MKTLVRTTNLYIMAFIFTSSLHAAGPPSGCVKRNAQPPTYNRITSFFTTQDDITTLSAKAMQEWINDCTCTKVKNKEVIQKFSKLFDKDCPIHTVKYDSENKAYIVFHGTNENSIPSLRNGIKVIPELGSLGAGFYITPRIESAFEYAKPSKHTSAISNTLPHGASNNDDPRVICVIKVDSGSSLTVKGKAEPTMSIVIQNRKSESCKKHEYHCSCPTQMPKAHEFAFTEQTIAYLTILGFFKLEEEKEEGQEMPGASL